MEKTIFYRNHPEAREGEVLAIFIGEPFLEYVKWETKRAGESFLNNAGCSIMPVFIQESEAKEGLPWLEIRDWSERPGTPSEW